MYAWRFKHTFSCCILNVYLRFGGKPVPSDTVLYKFTYTLRYLLPCSHAFLPCHWLDNVTVLFSTWHWHRPMEVHGSSLCWRCSIVHIWRCKVAYCPHGVWLSCCHNETAHFVDKNKSPKPGLWTTSIFGWCSQQASWVWHPIYLSWQRPGLQWLLHTRNFAPHRHRISSIWETWRYLEAIPLKSTNKAENIHILGAVISSSWSRHMDHHQGWWRKTTNFPHAVPAPHSRHLVVRLHNQLRSQTPAKRHSSTWHNDTLPASVKSHTSMVPRPGWKRKPGWPPCTWLRDVLKATCLTAREAWTAADNREEWTAQQSTTDYAFWWWWLHT